MHSNTTEMETENAKLAKCTTVTANFNISSMQQKHLKIKCLKLHEARVREKEIESEKEKINLIRFIKYIITF